jgi:hypothetical protein
MYNLSTTATKLLFFALLLAGLKACNPPETPAKAAPSAQTLSQMAASPDSIPARTALQEQAAWDSTRLNIIRLLGGPSAPPSRYLVKGFQIPVADLKGILAAYSDGNQPSRDSIYAMLSIRNGQSSLILETTDQRTGKKVYYDFSKPCPPNCDN